MLLIQPDSTFDDSFSAGINEKSNVPTILTFFTAFVNCQSEIKSNSISNKTETKNNNTKTVWYVLNTYMILTYTKFIADTYLVETHVYTIRAHIKYLQSSYNFMQGSYLYLPG